VADSLSLAPPFSRRDAFRYALLTATVVGPVIGAVLAVEPVSTVLVRGTVSLPFNNHVGVASPSDETATAAPASPALYITCRPDRPDNVPAAILSGTRGKPPAVLTARFENPTFPFEFVLTKENITPEGSGTGSNDSNTFENYEDDDEKRELLWWRKDELIVSARWDSDGVAATRSPDDLVGRSSLRQQSAELVNISLQGRGAFGKFATKKS